MRPLSWRPLTSPATSSTLPPPCRTGGSLTLIVLTLDATSTPSVAGSVASIFFFLAFMMLGSVAYRGSFSRRSVVMIMGRSAAMVSSPPSISRVTVARPPSRTTLEAKAAWGRPMRAASICPVWFESSSIACFPRKKRSGFSRSATALSSFATPNERTSPSILTWIARSAPMASAVLSVSCDVCGPTDTATISVTTPFSLRRTASSTAISQKGFMLIFTPAVSTPEWSGFTRILTA
mmetsp:Transcript_22479/g.53943  ORF Transcript_22479/g.53943 Transcript_22479/m.53943 type:complete len:236 (-) Transcript_22479:101-808(-)